MSYASGLLPDEPVYTYVIRNRAAPLLPKYLDANDTPVEMVDDGQHSRDRMVATVDHARLYHETFEYRATAIVRSDGTVSHLEVTCGYPGTALSVQTEFMLDNSEDVTPIQPEWIEEVIAETKLG